MLRPQPWRQLWVWLLLLIIGAIWAPEIAFPSSGHLATGIVGLVLVGGVLGYVLSRIRLVVTPDAVVMRDVPVGRGGSAPQAEVRSVHIYSARVCLQAHGDVLLRIAPYWSAEQLTTLAAELRVPLVTHKRLFGLTDDRNGTVLYQPPQGPPRSVGEPP